MLVELIIRKLALIEESSLSFGPGLNVITGETGAGKSLLVGALELLMGQRPKPGMVRSGARQLVVEGRFVVPADQVGERVRAWLEGHIPEVLEEWEELGAREDRELIVGRTVSREGKSRAHVNHHPVTQRVLRELAVRLFEIHGQNEHQRLLDPSEQLRLLDAFGGLDGELRGYRETRASWLELVERALRLEAEQKERRDRLDLARFQLGELEAAHPDAHERAQLATERDLLRHAEGLKEKLGSLVEELSESELAVLDRLHRAERLLEQWSRDIGALRPPQEELAAAVVHVEEAARVLRSFHERVDPDPLRLEAVEARLAGLERLEKKYGSDTAGLLQRIPSLRAEIEALEQDELHLEHLGPALRDARASLLEKAFELRRARKALAGKLRKAVQKTLAELGLEQAEFDLRLGQRTGEEGEPAHLEVPHVQDREALEADRLRFGERGMDRIEFLLAANPGEGLAKLRQVASGGETARIMLALRSVLVGADRDRTLVFDEIDAGVGGRLGPAVGAHLRNLAEQHQVVCVTHLPAIAAVAHKHLRVTKSVRSGRTHTAVAELRGDARVEEIADMIAGGSAHETARAEARRLMGQGAS
jgi:DNA repair protein RecN (Recombination protein N)